MFAPIANAQDRDCSDFETQVRVGSNDPDNLDEDGDGIGCENLPAGGGGDQQALANTGFEAWMVGLVGLALIGGAVALHRTGRAPA